MGEKINRARRARLAPFDPLRMSLQRIRVVRLLDKEYTTILSAPKQLLCMNGCRSHRRQYARAVATRQCIRYTINLGRYYPHSRCLETSRSISSAQHVQPKQVGGSSSFVIPTESKLENNPDIFVDDLEATLEAHRATNKAKIIRHIPVPPDPAVKHITPGVRDDYEDHAEASGAENPSELVNESIDHQAAVAETSSKEETKALRPWDYWPPGTKQYRQFVQNPIQLKRGIVREYEARVMIPCGTWRRPVKEYKHTDAFRPWLKLVSDSGGDAVQR